jgi:hypothetical protein
MRIFMENIFTNSKLNQNKLYHLKNWKNPIFANRAFFFEHTVYSIKILAISNNADKKKNMIW